MKFYCESKAKIPLPPLYTFPQAFNYLNSKTNSFYILEEEGVGYVQCAGEKLRCCIEYRDCKNGKQYRLAKGENNDEKTQIIISNGHVVVRLDEILTIDDAIDVFKEFHSSALISNTFRLNELDNRFHS